MQPETNNLFWHQQSVTVVDRSAIKRQNPCVIWLTGLSGSGKSTIANALEWQLIQRACHSYLLDGDNIRHGLCRDLGFSAAHRQENIRRIGEVAALMVDAGLIVITAFISPFLKDRALVRAMLPQDRFFEVFVDAPLDLCKQRDPKGLYRRAELGQIRDFTGVDSPYEPPDAPEITVDTQHLSVDACVQKILARVLSSAVESTHSSTAVLATSSAD